MPRTDITKLTDDARIWIFGISPPLTDAQMSTVFSRIDPFLDEWSAHGHPITSARDVLDHRFLLIAVEKSTETSGCSIDRLFGTMRELERELGVAMLDPDQIFFRHGDGRIDAISRREFRERADLHTVVFDTTAEQLSDVRNGQWERRASESWHRDLLRSRSAETRLA